MPLGNPIRKQNESRMVSVLATEGQTVFTVQGGYIINHISVFRNGVRLSPAEDFTAGDGSTVTLNNAANIDDRIDFHIFDRFTVQNAIIGAASTQTINGDLVLNGKLFGQLDVPSINLTGIITATELDLNGKGDISGDLNVTGITTATNLNVTGITTSSRLNVTGFSTFTGVIRAKSAAASLPSSGTSLEIYYASNILTDAPSGYLISYDRDAGAYKKITYDALEHKFRTSDTLKLHINPSGVNIAGVTTTTGLVSNGDVNITDKIQHVEDSDTAIRFPGNDTFTVETAGTERLRINSSGSLLLGTTVANERAHIHTASSAKAQIQFTNTTTGTSASDGFTFGITNAEEVVFANQENTAMYFSTNNTERLRITSAGKIEVKGTRAGALQASDDDTLQLYTGSTDESINRGAGITFYNHDGSGSEMGGTIQVAKENGTADNVASYMRFATRPAGGSATEALRIHSDGKLSLGTDSSASAKFNISHGNELALYTSGPYNYQAKFESTDAEAAIVIEDSNSGDNYNRIGVITNDMTFITNNSERLRINSQGKVLVNTTTASSAGNSQYSRLEVSGNSSTSTGPGHLSIKRGTVTGSLSNGDTLGRLIFSSLDGGDFAYIQAAVDSTPGSSDYPGRMMFYTAPDGSASALERMRIDKDGKVGINGTSLNGELTVCAVSGNAPHVDIGQDGGNRFKLGYEGNNCFLGASSSSGMFIFKNNVSSTGHPQVDGTERMRIDGSGRLMLGTTTSSSNQSGRLNVFGTDGDTAYFSIRRGSNNASGPRLAMCKSRNTTDGAASGLVQDGDILGSIHFYANDSQGFEEGACIQAIIDGTPGSNDVPTRLSFQTTPNGSDTKIERMRITNAGCVNIGSQTNDNETDFLNILQPQASNHHSVHLTGHTSSSFSGSDVLKCVLHGFYRQSYGQNGFLFKNADDHGNNRGVRVHKYQRSDGNVVGSIFFNSSSTDFNTSSDYRIKENEVLISDGIVRIKKLKPYRFNFKGLPEVVDGFFAHEVAEVVPQAVGGEKDEMKPNAWYKEGDTIPAGKAVGDVKGYSDTEMEIQQLDYSKLVPLLTSALQEAIAKIETLEAKVAALEGS